VVEGASVVGGSVGSGATVVDGTVLATVASAVVAGDASEPPQATAVTAMIVKSATFRMPSLPAQR
jgi:hypothetical protein